MRLDRRPCGLTVAKSDSGDESTKSEVAEGLLRGKWQCAHGRPPRTQPAADEARNQRATSAAERQRNGADFDAQETSEQAGRDASSEKGDVGTIARAQDLPHLGGGA